MNSFRRSLLGIALLGLALGAANPLRAEPRGADDAVKAARKAARADRHEEAIDAFLRAIEADSKRRRVWLPELADQLTWSGRLDEAIELYREVSATDDPAEAKRGRLGLARALSWQGDHSGALAEYERVLAGDPADREARLGRARVLSWSDRQDSALDQYEALMRDHPDDVEAHRGIGRVQSWRGRHREAAAQMRQLLQDHPHDRQASLILAESLRWMGRPDRAERVLHDQLAADPGDERAAELLEDIEFRQNPDLRIDWRESDQSNDLRISRVSLDADFHLANGRSSLSPRYESAVYRPDESSVDRITVDRAGLRGHHRISDSLDWHGGLFVDRVDTRDAAGDDEHTTWDTYFTYWPNDLFRFDVGNSRQTFDSEEALRQGLTATRTGASMDVVPNELTRVTARYSWTDYSDRNERNWWQLEAERRVRHRPRITIGYRYTGFEFSDPGMEGYYNPDRYDSHEALLRTWGRFGDRLRWSLASAVGYEIENPGTSRTIWNAEATCAWEFARGFELELAYDRFSSRTASTGGFERGTGRLTLRRVF